MDPNLSTTVFALFLLVFSMTHQVLSAAAHNAAKGAHKRPLCDAQCSTSFCAAIEVGAVRRFSSASDNDFLFGHGAEG